MNTTTSTVSHVGALSQHRTHVRIKNNDSYALLTKISTIAEEFVGTFDRVAPGGSENFYQDHVIAILWGSTLRWALGPLIGALTIYLYSH